MPEGPAERRKVMSWYKLDLGNAHTAHGRTLEISQSFRDNLILSEPNMDAALFSRYDTRNDMLTLYFAPGSADLAKRWGATECSKPEIWPGRFDRIGCLGGEGGALDFHFPDQGQG